ncbi:MULTISPECIES: type II toxin-antitoxin system RelE/ParE family toxin [unclassified Legionella]|uniref:type II toxin-antitoxin system RelE/ParE family toxin n=1 Tax=unclassified Legionella TaxID=2622702 RepID=UPI001F5F9D65|nr:MULTISPECIES: type II toxin-antitoxin system RelE/ParE family toxin [unclassified Legionella]MDI9819911.1 type II toxin-antitoxin system RelE/ParE family toxin [Legionella sp. PL877]
MPAFKKAFKKLHNDQKEAVKKAIRNIIENPEIGTAKKGDLAGVFVYKFKINNQEYLLAYEWLPQERILLALGVHENFYRNLKR